MNTKSAATRPGAGGSPSPCSPMPDTKPRTGPAGWAGQGAIYERRAEPAPRRSRTDRRALLSRPCQRPGKDWCGPFGPWIASSAVNARQHGHRSSWPGVRSSCHFWREQCGLPTSCCSQTCSRRTTSSRRPAAFCSVGSSGSRPCTRGIDSVVCDGWGCGMARERAIPDMTVTIYSWNISDDTSTVHTKGLAPERGGLW
jgi:hypothetical protein